MKRMWRRWYVKAAVAMVAVVALLAVVGYVALKPTYTADEVTKKMQDYLRGKVFSESHELLTNPRGVGPEIKTTTTRCASVVGDELALHYIPYRKAWLITTRTVTYIYTYTWLFDERTGTIASSNPLC